MTKTSLLRIKQTKSLIGKSKSHKATMKGLGLRKIGQMVELKDTAAARGMIMKVQHLIAVLPSS